MLLKGLDSTVFLIRNRKKKFKIIILKLIEFFQTIYKKYENFSFPYMEKDGEIVKIPFIDIKNVGPAGSINSNLEDMIKWIFLHLNRGSFQGKTFTSEEIFKEIHSPQIPVFKATQEIIAFLKFIETQCYEVTKHETQI